MANPFDAVNPVSLISPTLTLIKQIYEAYTSVQSHKEECKNLLEMVKTVEHLDLTKRLQQQAGQEAVQPIRFLEEVLQEVKAFMWDCRRKHTFKAMLVVANMKYRLQVGISKLQIALLTLSMKTAEADSATTQRLLAQVLKAVQAIPTVCPAPSNTASSGGGGSSSNSTAAGTPAAAPLIGELFPDVLCPITLEVMKDPVILVQTGHTYERSAIEAWLGEGNTTEPKTGVHLHDRILVPNHVVRCIIDSWQTCHPDTQAAAAADIALEQHAARHHDTAAAAVAFGNGCCYQGPVLYFRDHGTAD